MESNEGFVKNMHITMILPPDRAMTSISINAVVFCFHTFIGLTFGGTSKSEAAGDTEQTFTWTSGKLSILFYLILVSVNGQTSRVAIFSSRVLGKKLKDCLIEMHDCGDYGFNICNLDLDRIIRCLWIFILIKMFSE